MIVGEFGETVVIDWGLAKDRSAAEERPAEDRSPERPSGDELTTAGGVVGTPAYMAPEQARGQPVDQRVDVFAIGAMLWELCTRARVPPGDPDQRQRLLRREAIDQDLAAIIGKALAPDPRDRYPDAAALAADLKAFQAGARIAARDYSLPAMLAHWTRRHRMLSISVAAVTVLAVAGIVAFVTNIAVERDRADASAIEARTQQRRAEQVNDALTLQHAELQLRSNPTAAMATLETYRGADTSQLRRLRAEAVGRGVAAATLRPHGEAIAFLAGEPDGSVLSAANDRTIRLTRGAETTTLATNVALPMLVHASAPGLLAYVTSTQQVAVLALAPRRVTTLDVRAPRAMDFAQDASRLLTLAADGSLRVWRLSPDIAVVHEERFPGAVDAGFATPARIVVRYPDALRTLWLDSQRKAAVVALPSSAFDANDDYVAVSNDHGVVTLLSTELAVLARATPCRKTVMAINLVPHSELVAFACEEGVVGVARYDRAAATLTVDDTFPTRERAYRARPDPMGKHIVAADDSNLIYVYDVKTRIARAFDGQPAQVTWLEPATPEFNHILAGDRRGTVRIWDPPPPNVRKLLQAPSAVVGVVFAADGESILTSAADGLVRQLGVSDGGVAEFRGHTGVVLEAAFSPDGHYILSYSRDDGTARTWRTSDGKAGRVLSEHGRTLARARFLATGHRIVSIGGDGRLLAWSPETSDVFVLFTRPLGLTALEVLPYNEHVVVQDVAGSIWDVAPGGGARQVRAGDDATVTVLRASADGRLVATGTTEGAVVVYDTTRWAIIATAKLGGGVTQIRFDPNNRELIAASDDQHVGVIALGAARALRWHDIPLAARNITYGPDGETVAFVGADGGTWYYDIRGDRWAFTLDHASETFNGVFSPDSALFASVDRRGVVTVRDVPATFAAAAAQP